MRKSSYLILMLAFLSLAACEAVNKVAKGLNEELRITKDQREDNEGAQFVANQCPQIKAVNELTGLYQYTDFSVPADENLISSVHITEFESTCEIHEKSVTVDLKLTFEADLGPKATMTKNDKPLFAYPFFVAITGPRGKIFAKEVFAASITFNRGEDTHYYHENLRQIIPINDPDEAKRYTVMVGFQLNEEQLAFNRGLINPETLEPETSKYVQPVSAASSSGSAPAAFSQTRTQEEATTTIKIVRPSRPTRSRQEVVVPYGMPNPPQAAEPAAGSAKLSPPKNVVVPNVQ